MEREIKNEQEVLGQFVRALRHRKPSPRCARVLLAPSPAPLLPAVSLTYSTC
jgi:hypothetical protein